MRKQLLIPALAIALMAATQAQAQMTFEPYVGYNLFGSASSDPVATPDNSISGLGFGARALYGMENFFGGLDFRMNMLTEDFELAATTDQDLDNMQLGLVLGASFDMFRVWGGLNFMNKFTAEDDSYFKGMGFKFGAGYKFHEYVSVNAEYMINPVSEACSATDVCADLPDGTSASANGFFLSVSAPISF